MNNENERQIGARDIEINIFHETGNILYNGVGSDLLCQLPMEERRGNRTDEPRRFQMRSNVT